jgi:hypothetical protein
MTALLVRIAPPVDPVTIAAAFVVVSGSAMGRARAKCAGATPRGMSPRACGVRPPDFTSQWIRGQRLGSGVAHVGAGAAAHGRKAATARGTPSAKAPCRYPPRLSRPSR